MICQRPKSNTVFVSQIEDIAPQIRRIRICGERIRKMRWSPGQKIKIKVGTYLRSYTPAKVDSNLGWLDLIFHIHGKGVASKWAQDVCLGARISFIGPIDSMPSFDESPKWCLFLGDETTLGLSMALLNSMSNKVEKIGAIELSSENLIAVETLQLPLTPVQRDGQYGYAILQWLSQVQLPEGNGIIWVSGEVQMVRNLRLALITRGVQPEQIKVKPYWSLKGHAHRTSLQKVM